MKTKPTFQNGQLTICVSGHIDSSKTVLLQQEIQSYIADHEGDIEELILDIEEMTFISSAGLRVILKLKQQFANLLIINCSADVYNVFEMTGFTKILNVKRALAQVSLEGVPAVDGLIDTYQLSDETMLKLYAEDTTKADVEREIQLSREMFVLGVPTAMTFDIVKVGSRYGLIFESVELKDADAKTLGELMRNMHEHTVEPGGSIPSVIDREKKMIRQMADTLGEDVVAKLTQLLNLIPEGSSLLHGKFTAQKVAYQNDAPIMIDMSGVSYGNPIIDLAHFYSSLSDELRGEFFDEFLQSYYDVESEATIAHNRQNIVTLALAQDCNKEYILNNWEEILSKLHFKMDFAEEIRKLERKRFYLDSNVNIDWVASTLGTNRHYVSDYFNKVLHTTFNDYINTLRLDYAAELIRTGKVKQSQVAYSAGFNNDHTFRRLFKDKFGCTPSQFCKE